MNYEIKDLERLEKKMTSPVKSDTPTKNYLKLNTPKKMTQDQIKGFMNRAEIQPVPVVKRPDVRSFIDAPLTRASQGNNTLEKELSAVTSQDPLSASSKEASFNYSSEEDLKRQKNKRTISIAVVAVVLIIVAFLVIKRFKRK